MTCNICNEPVDPMRMDVCPRCNTPIDPSAENGTNRPVRGYPHRPMPARRKSPLRIVVLAVCAAGVLTAVLVTGLGIGGPGHRPAPGGSKVASTGARPAPTGSLSPTPSMMDPAEAAAAIDALIEDSGDNRADLNETINRVDSCMGTTVDVSILRRVGAERQRQHAKAQNLTVDALPGGSDLQGLLLKIFDVSGRADGRYTEWARAKVEHCTDGAGDKAWHAA